MPCTDAANRRKRYSALLGAQAVEIDDHDDQDTGDDALPKRVNI